ncbi:MAG TPA: hypothetical protein VNM14_02025 [Planctomycetota bacterium]|jgi:hypothetical protein|nr:hypothetical protein [Planctomycetota bacterium]
MLPNDDVRKLLSQLRSGIVSTREEAPVQAFPTSSLAGSPAITPGTDEIYVEVGEPKEDGKEPKYEDRISALPTEVSRQIRRRAWEEYARRVADGSGDRRRRKKIRLGGPGPAAWLELAIWMTVLIGTNLLAFPHDPGFRRVEFNPFLLPVILLAIRFGTLIGGAAGIAGAGWMLLSTRHASLEDGSLVLPGLTVLVGMLTGILSQHQGERLAHFRTYAGTLEARQARARRLLAVKDSVIHELQSRIEEQTVSVEAMYRWSRHMSSSEATDMFQALLQLLHADLSVTRAAVYRRRDDGYVLAASLDRGSVPAPFAERLDPRDGLVAMALEHRRPISAFDPEAESLRGPARPGILLCGPVCEEEMVEAMVVVHEMPLLELTPASCARFDALLNWASEARSRLAHFREQSDPDFFDRRIGAYRFSYFSEALRRENLRARRHGLPLKVLRARITSFAEIPPGSVPAARECVSRALFAYLREDDTIGLAEQEDTFLAILPMCESATATAIGFRMIRALEGVTGLLPLKLAFDFVDPETLEAAPKAPMPALEAVA